MPADNTLWLVLPIITAAIAFHKGYNPFLWILNFGLIGLIVLAFLPRVDREVMKHKDAEYQAWVGNWWGGILTALHVIAEIAWMFYQVRTHVPDAYMR